MKRLIMQFAQAATANRTVCATVPLDLKDI